MLSRFDAQKTLDVSMSRQARGTSVVSVESNIMLSNGSECEYKESERSFIGLELSGCRYDP